MVRVSDKQLLLNSILNTLEASIWLTTENNQQFLSANHALTDSEDDNDDNDYSDSSDSSISSLESKGGLDDGSSSSSSSSSDKSSDDDDNPFASKALLALYSLIQQQRYTVTRTHGLFASEKLIDTLDRCASTNRRMFRGMVRMTPEAFEALAAKLQFTPAFNSGRTSIKKVREMLSVTLWRLGRSGNGGGERDGALRCGYSVGSFVGWTDRTIRGLLELNKEVMRFATEQERANAKAWVKKRAGSDEWGRGWLVVDGTHIRLACAPSLLTEEHRNYKGFFSFNVAVVIMPHSLRIVETVVGPPGSMQDSRVWTLGTNILKKPRLYLDEGEFIWVDGGYGFSPHTCGPFLHINASKSKDLKFFNQQLSSIRGRVEHAIAYLKNRFQCLLAGYRGNIYRVLDLQSAADTIQACIIAHTFASQYDRPEEIAELAALREQDVSSEGVEGLGPGRSTDEEVQQQQRANQRQYAAEERRAKQTLSKSALDDIRLGAAHDLREEMFMALFNDLNRPIVDTTATSRRYKQTEAAWARTRGSTTEAAGQQSSSDDVQ